MIKKLDMAEVARIVNKYGSKGYKTKRFNPTHLEIGLSMQNNTVIKAIKNWYGLDSEYVRTFNERC